MSHPLDPYTTAAIFGALAPFFGYMMWRTRPTGDEICTMNMISFVLSGTMLFLVLFIVAKVLVRGTLH